MYKDYDNYRTYENDDLSAGATLKVEHTIIVNEIRYIEFDFTTA